MRLAGVDCMDGIRGDTLSILLMQFIPVYVLAFNDLPLILQLYT